MDIAVVIAAFGAFCVLLVLQLRGRPSASSADVGAAVATAVESAVARVRADASDERDAAIRTALDQAMVATSALSAQQQQALQQALEATKALGADQRGAVEATLRSALEATTELGRHQRQAVEQALEAKTKVVGNEVAQLREQMVGLVDMVQELEGQRRQQAGALDATLKSLGTTTRSLTEALASPKTRGQWGERTAEDLLRHLGMVEGIHFIRQTANAAGTIPDITFLLPDERKLHMDVKFPIDAYLRYLEADSDADRQRHEASFLKAVRARIRELRGRDYIDPEAGTVDQVLCFVPNEAVYAFICERGPQLLDEALADRVVLCSPTNLYALLSVVRQASELLQVERTSDEVLSLLGAFDKQWTKYCDQMDLVERQFITVQKSFDNLTGTRRRQLAKPLDRLDALRNERGLPVAAGYDPDDAPVATLRAVGDDSF
ncbi:MAG TPA: DNA recombination protein RmuC [Acidimicrobiales bacterium]